MSSKVIDKTDYRYGLGDKYGRRNCDNCGKYRRINAYWSQTNKVLCTECSISGNNALNYSMRGGSINLRFMT